MTPTATLVREACSLTLFFAVDGVEPRPVWWYESPAAMYQPEGCALEYLEEGALWGELCGKRIEKDGTLGRADEESFWNYEAWPDWLWDLAAEHAPEWFTMPERSS